MIQFTLFSFVSKVDSKGRVSIPIKLRAKLKIIEGCRVKILAKKGRLILIPEKWPEWCKGSTGVCGTPGAGSNPASGPKEVILWYRKDLSKK